MADIVIETDRFVLRKHQDGDLQLHARHLNTPAMMARLGGPMELHEIEAKHAKSLALFAREGFGFMMVIEKGTGELVGQVGLKRVDAELANNKGDFEIGWLVREDRWRMGYAFEAVHAVLDWAFNRFQAPLVVALTSESNEPSWRLMQKLGMERRADLDFEDNRFPPEDNPTILYSISRAEWEKTR